MTVDNIKVVLVHTTHPGNIGGVARAMKNMGLSRLILVEPREYPAAEARWRAASAADVLDGAEVVSSVEEAVAGARHVVDLFSGAGTFTFPIAAAAPVHAVEGDRAMIAALDHGTRHATGIKKVTAEQRDLFRRPLMAEDLAPYDAAIIDPPRAGAEAQVRELAASDVARIGFVSCNPVTFARDAKILTDAGYRLDWVQVVDQFRWSPHIELAAAFSRPHM